MLLADMGADVVRLDRSDSSAFAGTCDPTLRGRQTLAIDLKTDGGREAASTLAARADALIEGFRPGVMERLGLGPDTLLASNPRLVYGRMTGYGQDGPLARVAGHDINYVALAGALSATRRRGELPMFALNLVGDYGGGALFLAFGVVCALFEARGSGRGQVIDAAMVDGVALLTALVHGMHAAGAWSREPGANLLDSGAHFYEVYAAADGGHVAVGALEPKFYARLLELLGIPLGEMPQWERERWPEFKERLAGVFGQRAAADWQALLEPEEACVTVLRATFDAHVDPHLAARRTFIELDGVRQPGPAPRLSRTPAQATPARHDPRAALGSWDLSPVELERVLRACG
jgi:alpha-methylacyl-CoA racemase